MVTDRSTTAGLICYLATVYPGALLAFQLLLGLDLASHYMHMYASLTAGSTSHKVLDGRQNWLLRAYYHKQTVMFTACAGNELFFLGLYLSHHFSADSAIFGLMDGQLNKYQLMTAIAFPIFAFKQFMNGVQLVGASQRLAALETKKPSRE